MNRRLVRERVVTDKTGLSRATVWRKVKESTFPSPIRLGPHSVAWVEAEVDQWIDSRIAASRPAQQVA